MKKERGITLIALVITIIVLIILAGVSIQLLLGENGIITKAKKGKGDYQEASIKEKVEIALVDYNSDKITNGEEGQIEEALNNLLDNGTFEDIEIEENIGIIEDYEITLGKEKGEIIIESIDKVTGNVRLRCKLSTREYTKESITINVKATGNIVKLIKPDNTEETPIDGKIEINYLVNQNGNYIFKVEDIEGNSIEKTVVVKNIDTLIPKDFDITAEQVDKKLIITAKAEDEEATETSACSGIDRYEYFVKKSTDTNYPETPYTNNEIEISEYGTYHIFVKVYDKAGNSKECNEEITIEIVNPKASKYGQKVNYSVNGVDDWKIFYINEERNETFIITSGFLPNENVSTDKTGMTTYGTYRACWVTAPNYIEISDEIRNKFMMSWLENETNKNIRCVSRLLDTSAWSNLVTEELKEKGVTAVGAPTLEMFIASWNDLYPLETISHDGISNYGYCFPGSYYKRIELKDTMGRNNSLYFPTSPDKQTSRYWLSSPAGNSINNPDQYLVSVDNSTTAPALMQDGFTQSGYEGIRPLLCIPSNLLSFDYESHIWNIR